MMHELMGAVACERLATTLEGKCVKAFFGPSWDGANDHRHEGEFWYFSPMVNGGVNVTVYYNHGGVYDAGELQPEMLSFALAEVDKLRLEPPRVFVWKAFERARDRWRKEALDGMGTDAVYLASVFQIDCNMSEGERVVLSRRDVERAIELLRTLARL